MGKRSGRARRRRRLTDVTPDEEVLTNVAIPDDGVHPIDNIERKQPNYDGDGGDIARTPVCREGDKDKNSGDERSDGELRMKHGRQTSKAVTRSGWLCS